MKRYDVVSEASTLVRGQLELLQALYLAKQTMAEGKSRLVCRCGACKTHRRLTLSWLDELLIDKETLDRISRYPATAQIERRPSDSLSKPTGSLRHRSSVPALVSAS